MMAKNVIVIGCLLIMSFTECICRPNIGCLACPQPTGCGKKADGTYYSEGERISGSINDPCRVCTCRGGKVHCDQMFCLDVYCAGQYTEPGVCCPMCPPPQLMR